MAPSRRRRSPFRGTTRGPWGSPRGGISKSGLPRCVERTSGDAGGARPSHVGSSILTTEAVAHVELGQPRRAVRIGLLHEDGNTLQTSPPVVFGLKTALGAGRQQRVLEGRMVHPIG